MAEQGIRGPIVENAAMKRYTSMKVGGTVPYLVSPVDEDDLAAAVRWFRSRRLPFRFVGNGTNLIVADKGMKAGVIRTTKMRHIRFRKTEDGATVDAAAGVGLKTLIRQCAARGLSGIEKLFGIPGTVGGAVRMNAGSFGVTISDCLASVRIMNKDGKVRSVARDRIAFGYRTSPFHPDECIVGATFRLQGRRPEEIRKDMEYVWRQRCEKHPMEFPSSGSIFKNKNGIPCWRRIDEAGLRGLAIGGARVSEKHANFIVNTGGASADDVKRLIETVKRRVGEACGVALEEEVELWGFDE